MSVCVSSGQVFTWSQSCVSPVFPHMSPSVTSAESGRTRLQLWAVMVTRAGNLCNYRYVCEGAMAVLIQVAYHITHQVLTAEGLSASATIHYRSVKQPLAQYKCEPTM